MGNPRAEITETVPMLPPLPGWITSRPAETLEDAAFLSGAALAHLHLVAKESAIPQDLWRARLALAAAEVCVVLSGRREGAAGLRDALLLTRPGDHPGPAGDILRQWSRAVVRPVSVVHLAKTIVGASAERIALCLDASGRTPVERAARVLEAVLTEAPRAETAALILADAVLSKALGSRLNQVHQMMTAAMATAEAKLMASLS